MTIRDLAQRAGVSPSTVSRALAGNPLIHPETRERIRRLAEETGYRPNLVARSLTRKATCTIGLVAPGVANPFFGELIERVSDRVRADGYSVLLATSGQDEAGQAECLSALEERQVDGIILMTGMHGLAAREEVARLQSRGIPVVISGWVEDAEDLDMVACDDAAGGYALTRHLLSLGHRRLALVGPRLSRGRYDRIRGFERALAEAGPEAVGTIHLGALDCASTEQLMAEVLREEPRPTVVFAYSDALAAWVLRYLRGAGLRVPEDLAVVGFDDVELAGYFDPPLTTVAYPTTRLVDEMVHLLTDRLKSPVETPSKHVMLTPCLVVRRSCGAGSPRFPAQEASLPERSSAK